jgi:hypothetical protein
MESKNAEWREKLGEPEDPNSSRLRLKAKLEEKIEEKKKP